MVHFSSLHRLPDGIQFPDLSHGRIWYDADNQRLAFDGFMSKSTFDRLHKLHDDSSYRRAMEDLFQHAVVEHTPQTKSQRSLVVAICAGVAAIAIAVAIALVVLR